MSFPRYPKYKDSGVEWLGEVPEHWTVRRLKFLCDIQTGDKDTENAVEEGIYPFFVRSQTVERINSSTFDCEAVLTAGDGVGVGKVFHYYNGPFDFHQRVYMLNRFRTVSGRFLFHFLRENFYKVALEGGAKSTVDSLRRPLFTNFPISYPPEEEQQSIVQFAEREAAKIDELVAEQQRLMELLKEKRQAVISHAVTKGLNPRAPMKPSGIEWLGDVPEHWTIARLSYGATVENSTTPSRDKAEYWFGGSIPWLSSGEVNQYRINEASEFITDRALAECSLRLLPKGTVVVGMIGQGKTRGLAATLEMEAAINQNLAGLVTRPNLKADYLLYIFQSVYEYLREYGRGGNQAALNCEILSALKVPMPPLVEQSQICAHLEVRLSEFDALAAEAQKAIDLLQERRTALISAAVTGQIDVRKLAAA